MVSSSSHEPVHVSKKRSFKAWIKSLGRSDGPNPSPSPVIPKQLVSYPEAVSREPGDTITSAEPRACRKLLREIYALNVYISNLGDVFEVNKPIILEKKRQADGALMDLRRVVKEWMEVEGEWTPAELAIITQIYDRIQAIQPVPLTLNDESHNTGSETDEDD